MNIKSGKVIELNVSYDKTLNNPLFTGGGVPNLIHYFWRITWFKGLNGTYAICSPNAEDTKAIELGSGKAVTLFHSMLGSIGWESKYTQGNKLKVTEVKKFGTGEPEVIEDFETFFQGAKMVSSK